MITVLAAAESVVPAWVSGAVTFGLLVGLLMVVLAFRNLGTKNR